MKFKLLAGIHQSVDTSRPPQVLRDPVTGKETFKYPSKTYVVGDIIESDIDLAKKHGSAKFQLVGTSRAAAIPNDNSTAAPTGQVSSGFQQTGPVGHSAGPITREELEQRGILLSAADAKLIIEARGLARKAELQVPALVATDSNEEIEDQPAVSKPLITITDMAEAATEDDEDEEEQEEEDEEEDDGLELKTAAQLRQIATREGVDLHGAGLKAEMVRRIRAARLESAAMAEDADDDDGE